MAVITLYFNDAAASGSSHGNLVTSAPTGFNYTSTGWVQDTTVASRYSPSKYNNEQGSGTFGTTALPSGAPGTDDCWRSSGTYTRTIAAGNWTVSVPVACFYSSGATGRLRFRVWRSTSATGASATEITSGTQTGSIITASSSIENSSGTFDPGQVTLSGEYIFLQFAWEVTTQSGASDDCWVVVADPGGADPASPALVTPDEAAAGVTGTLSKTLGAVTSTGAGTVAVAGSVAKTLGATTSTAAGTVAVTGSASPTLGATTSTAAGAVAVTGATSATLGDVTLTGAGTVGGTEITGSLAVTLGATTSTAAGTVEVQGATAATLGAVTGAAAGAVEVAGAATPTLGAVTSTAAGAVAVTGSATPTLGAVTSTAAGTIPVVGAGAATLGATTSTAAGTVAVVGTLAKTLGAVTLAATGDDSTPNEPEVVALRVACATVTRVTVEAVGTTALTATAPGSVALSVEV